MSNTVKRVNRTKAKVRKKKKEDIFLDCLNKYIKRGFPLLQKTTQQSLANRFKYLEEGPLPKIKMKNLRSKHICDWLEWLKNQDTAHNRARKTFLKELETLNIVLNWYRNFEDERFNVPITKQHKRFCYYKKNPPRRPDYYAKPEELEKFIGWLKANRNSSVYWRLALFMVLTGARVGEACGMCWEEVDLSRGIARVIRTMSWDHNTKKPILQESIKTESSARLLLLSDDLIEILQTMKKETEAYKGLLFVNSQGRALNYSSIRWNFNLSFKSLNMPWRSTHILRHSYATAALMATKNISLVQASLGHSSTRMTERYAKSIALLNRDVAQKTSKFFNFSDF